MPSTPPRSSPDAQSFYGEDGSSTCNRANNLSAHVKSWANWGRSDAFPCREGCQEALQRSRFIFITHRFLLALVNASNIGRENITTCKLTHSRPSLSCGVKCFFFVCAVTQSLMPHESCRNLGNLNINIEHQLCQVDRLVDMIGFLCHLLLFQAYF